MTKEEKTHVKLVRDAKCLHPALYRSGRKVLAFGWCKKCRQKAFWTK